MKCYLPVYLGKKFQARCLMSRFGGPKQEVTRIVTESLRNVLGDEAAVAQIIESKSGFGEYQCSNALSLAKSLKRSPLSLASSIVSDINMRAKLAIDSFPHSSSTASSIDVQVSGPGFINIRLTEGFVRNRLARVLQDPNRCGIAPTTQPRKTIVDFSSPNIAKEMHVVSTVSVFFALC